MSSPVITFYKIALGLAASCALTVGGLLFVGNPMEIGPFLIGFFVMLAIGCRGVAVLKSFSYTIMIFAAVATALYYPGSFVEWNGLKLGVLITPLIQVIMFGMGTSMSFNDFAGVVRMPRGVLIGVSSHFLVMPLIGYALAKLSGFPPEIAAGMILIGCSPNGMASNVISYLAKANLALSITITAVSTLLAPIMMPLLMKWLAGAFVEINVLDMMLEITKMVIIPVLGGLLFNKFLSGRAKWLDKLMPMVSMFGIGFIIVIITAAGRKSLLAIGPLLLLLVLIHNLSGYTIGYWIGRLCRMSERDCRTVAIEVGMQNGGLASALARSMGKMATVGLAPAIFGPLMNITGSILASWWHRRPPEDQEKKNSNYNLYRTLLNKNIMTTKTMLGPSILLIALLTVKCGSGPHGGKPEWSDLNAKVIAEYNVKGRMRTDIPDTKVSSNLKAGKVTNISTLPDIRLAEGVAAKAYWGKGALMSFITMAPGAAIPESKISGERFLYVLSGEVKEWVNGSQAMLQGLPRDTIDGIHGRTPVREFVYLQEGARTAVVAGSGGAKILEVFSPVPVDYLQKAGMKDTPDPISIDQFPIAPSVEPNKVYNLYDLQYAQLVPGSNSRIVSGKGVQMSFLRMNPNTKFARHIHPEEQVMYTWRGAIDEILLDKTIKMTTGDIVDLPSNFVHGGNLSPEGCDVMDVFFPPRTDYNQFRVTRDSGYYAIIPKNATVKTVIDGEATKPGLTFTEGPAWLDGKLYFSNMYFDKDFKGNPRKSSLVVMDPDGSYRNVIQGKMQTNGLLATPDGQLIVCDMFGHRLLKMDTTGNILKVLAERFEGKPLDGPNDLCMDTKGGIYFSDPQFTGDAVKSQPGRTVYYLPARGKLTRLLPPNDFAMPNGLALSPDGKTLYIDNTYDDEKFWNVNSDKDNWVWAYDVQPDGTIKNGRKFAELHLMEQVLDRHGKSSGADGLRVDERGNVYVATWDGLQIFNPRGQFTGIINFPTYPVNLAFGGADGKTIYVTSYNKIYSIQSNVKGLSRVH